MPTTLPFALLVAALGLTALPPRSRPAKPIVLPLKAARQKGPGATVTVRGVVLNGPELAGLRFIQDRETGLALFALAGRVPGYDELQAGDSIQATGQLKDYNGLLEMDPVASVRQLGTGRPPRVLQVPAANMADAFTEANEGRLLEITDVSSLTTVNGDPVITLHGNANYLLNGDPETPMRVLRSSSGRSGLVTLKAPAPGRPFDVRGILSQYAPGGSGGYQLLPRLATDLTRGSAPVRGTSPPRFTAEPVPTHITPDGFTLEYTTRYPGDTRVRYGRAAQQLAEERVDTAQTTQHRLTLSGLEPGTTYYVQAGSRNAAGTTLAEPMPVTTGGRKGKRQ